MACLWGRFNRHENETLARALPEFTDRIHVEDNYK